MQDYNQPPAAIGPAKDHEELRLMMMANNIRHGKRFHYFDFHVFKGKLWCMFEVSQKDLVKVNNGNK